MSAFSDAWAWYEAARRSLWRVQRLGAKYWADRSLAGAAFWQDDAFRSLAPGAMVEDATTSLEPIDDLAVVVLFSAFESLVRDHLTQQIEPEAAGLYHPILRQAAEEALRGVAEGSFYRRVLGPLKEEKRLPTDLITLVDQVRDYRNWVAHGRRGAAINKITPRTAYDRLTRFLDALGIAFRSEADEPPHE